MSEPSVPGCSIYYGKVRHQRSRPVRHAFTTRLFLFGIDLDHVEDAMATSSALGFERFAHSSFRRRDFLGNPEQPLSEAVRDHVQTETGTRPTGPIELVTQLRTFGYSFNPVSFYYCWSPDRTQLEAIVAEITNTPWGERHAYVLPWDSDRRSNRWQFQKTFHISPFSPMELQHDWRFAQPGDRLGVHMVNRAPEKGAEFAATLLMERRPLNRREVRRALLRHPFMPGKTVLGIYWQALRLFVKRSPFHTHPDKRAKAAPSR